MLETPPKERYGLHIFLFIATLLTSTLAGAEWITGRSVVDTLPWKEVGIGLWYAVPFIAILTAHEFGHYFVSRYYGVSASLPYYLPMYMPIASIGTLGAFIRIRAIPKTKQQFFDIGIAGPLAGFVLALGVLLYGFTHLPPKEYIFKIHPEYERYGLDYEKHVYTTDFLQELDSLAFVDAQQKGIVPKTDSLGKPVVFVPQTEAYQQAMQMNLSVGSNLMFYLLTHYVASDPALVPNPYEMMHYPLLFAGYLALFFTALNLIPIGQLDGGHILYGLIGYENHRKVSPMLFTAYIFYGGLGVIDPTGYVRLLGMEAEAWMGIPLYLGYLYLVFDRMTDSVQQTVLLCVGVATLQWLVTYYFGIQGFPGWLVFGLVLGRFLGVYHPPALYEEPLSTGRQILGWISLGIFVLCFTPNPLEFGK